MALVQQINSFGSNHPGLNFLGGLAAGVVLTAVMTFAAVNLQSQNSVAAGGFVQSPISEEWAAPRTGLNVDGVIQSPADEELVAGRISGGQTFNLSRVRSEDEALSAPRTAISVTLAPARTSEDEALSAPRVGGSRTFGIARQQTEEEALSAPRVSVR